MILTSGRVVPNWILQLAFEIFNEDTTIGDLINDIEDIAQDELNRTEHGKLSAEDALEVFKKFNEIWPDYEDMLDEFFEKHDLGHDEYDGDDGGNGDDDSAPDDTEDNALREEPFTSVSSKREQ